MSFILDIMKSFYSEADAKSIYEKSYLLQYLEKKTKSVDRSSKARGSFANIYAIYVLTEDYINNGYLIPGKKYSEYEGMSFSDALKRTRQLKFGEKLQNHALNDRCNDEFKKFFHADTDEVPITRNLDTKKYWINEKLLLVSYGGKTINIADLCIVIIDKYVTTKTQNFSVFFQHLSDLKESDASSKIDSMNYISKLLDPSSDARIFEIVSYVILKYHYIDHTITYSVDGNDNKTCSLQIYKVGRTNANDGGIDYIMLPLGRVFQVTEVLDFKKYFLDIDKLIHYPITFVVKQDISPEMALEKIRSDAENIYKDEILKQYIDCFEEIVTIPILKKYLQENIEMGHLGNMIDELIEQCKVEYNFNNSN